MIKFANFNLKNNVLNNYFVNKEKKVIIIRCKDNSRNSAMSLQGHYSFLPFSYNTENKFKFSGKNIYKNKCINLIKNFVINGQQVFRTVLKLNGLGFRVFKFFIKDKNIFFFKFKLGFSHKLYIPIPKELIVSCRKRNKIILMGSNKQKLTNFAKRVQLLRLPGVYSNKGITFLNQSLRLKPGKKKN
uniref:Ribosomal protein L6 n=1 Tax=Cyanophora biloba TaxID=1489483 RepID=A0A873WYI4_9EUKA|nr:ribosomal protein L6 [Cyanophora biloba]QPB15017.1 ribosomal protein L6 [Cyanophora biloba]